MAGGLGAELTAEGVGPQSESRRGGAGRDKRGWNLGGEGPGVTVEEVGPLLSRSDWE